MNKHMFNIQKKSSRHCLWLNSTAISNYSYFRWAQIPLALQKRGRGNNKTKTGKRFQNKEKGRHVSLIS
jgi:hypothetical protein